MGYLLCLSPNIVRYKYMVYYFAKVRKYLSIDKKKLRNRSIVTLIVTYRAYFSDRVERQCDCVALNVFIEVLQVPQLVNIRHVNDMRSSVIL